MTLQEFIKENTGRYILEEKLEKLKQHVEMMKITTGTQFLSHSSDVDRYYEYINGYITAARIYGHITEQERDGLTAELIQCTDFRNCE